jgi:hypothetical protein
MRFWRESSARWGKNLCDTVVANFSFVDRRLLPRAFHTKALYECLPDDKSCGLGVCWADRLRPYIRPCVWCETTGPDADTLTAASSGQRTVEVRGFGQAYAITV